MLFGYACHCTTLGGEFNQICAEWAGYACDEIERQFPGSTALAIIGCGADANPEPRRNLDDAKQHGLAAAREVERLVKSTLTPLPGQIDARLRKLELPLEPPPDRAALERRAKLAGLRRVSGQEPDRPARPRRIARNPRPLLGRDLVLRRRAGHGFPPRRSRRRLRLALKWEIDQRPALGRCLQQRCPLLHPIAAHPQRGGYEADLSMVFYGHPTGSLLQPKT